MSEWNIPKEYLDQSKEIERLTTDRDEWERLWKKASVAVIDLQDEVEKLKEDRLDVKERIAKLEAIIDKGLDEGYIPNEWLQAEQANSEGEK